MDWITIKDNLKPEEGQVYPVSASKGNKHFLATAMYKDNSWYNYDSFNEKTGEDITDNVNAWGNNNNVFIG